MPSGLLRAVLGTALLFAQGPSSVLLKGRVESLEGEALPYALIRVPESGFQILSRGDGYFQLNLLAGKTLIEIRYLGFSPYQETLRVEPPGPVERTFRLRRQDIVLPSVMITEGGVNPAEILIRRAIQHKAANCSCLPAYRTEVYSLFSVRMPKGLPVFLKRLLRKSGDTLTSGEIIYMSESLSEADFQPPDRYREVIRYSRVVGERQYGFTGLWVLQGFDPYQDRLKIPEIMEAPLVLPLASDALAYYRYKIIGEVWDAEGFMYKIAFEPKNPQVGITGYLLLADETYAIRGLEGMLTGEQGARYVDTIQLRMQYAPVGPCWLPAEIQLRARVKVELVGQSFVFLAQGQFLNRRYTLLVSAKGSRASARPRPGSSTLVSAETLRAGFRLDTLRVERLEFSERLRIVEGAARPENSFWDSLRKVPLDSLQLLYIQRSDSLLKARDTLAGRSSRRGPSYSVGAEGLSVSMGKAKGDSENREVGLTLQWPAYTALEGWILRARVSLLHRYLRGREWEAALRLRYGLGWQRLLPEGGLNYRRSRFPPHTWEIWGGWQAREGPDQTQITLLWNTLYYLARREAPLQLYDRLYLRTRWGFRWHRNWQSAVEATYDRRPNTPARQSYYPGYRLALFAEWTPAVQLYRTPRSTILLEPEGPFQMVVRSGQEIALLPGLYLWSGYIGTEARLSLSPWGQWLWQNSLCMQSDSAPWADRFFPGAQPLILHRYFTDLAFWPVYQPAGRLVWQSHYQWNFQRALLRHVPLLRKTAWQEHFCLRSLHTEGRWHLEMSFWLTRIALGLGRWKTGLSLSLAVHYGLMGQQAGGWRFSLSMGTPVWRSLSQKRFTE